MSDTETVPIWQFREETGKLCDKIAELEKELAHQQHRNEFLKHGWRAENAANLDILRTLEKDKYWTAYEILMQLCAIRANYVEDHSYATIVKQAELFDEAMDMYEDRK